MGVPINLWSTNTFKDIGSIWGEVVKLKEDINNPCTFEYGRVRIVTSIMDAINTVAFLECNECKYPVRVCEDYPLFDLSKNCRREVSSKFLASNSLSVVCKQKLLNGNGRKEDEDDGYDSSEEVAKDFADVADNDVVANIAEDMVDREQVQVDGVNGGLADPVVNATEYCMGSIQGNESGNVEGLELVESSRNKVPVEIQNVVDCVCSPRFVRSICELERVGPNINLQILLNGL